MNIPKILAVVGARGGSKGILRKNIKPFLGKPLLAYSIEAAKQSIYVDRVVVSTEDKEIALIAKRYGAEVPFMRPKSLATDAATSDDVLVHTINQLFKIGYNFDVMISRDCTVPFIRNSDIKKSISLLKRKKANLVIGVYDQHLNPYYNIVEITKNNHLRLCKQLTNRPTSRQKAPKVFQMNGLHTYDVKKFLFPKRKVRTEISKAIPLEIPIETGIMIDTEFEFQLVKLIIENKYQLK